MDRLLARLDRTLGRFAIERLTTFIVGGTAIAFVLMKLRPELLSWLVLDPHVALKQPWRFVSFLFVPQDISPIWLFFALYWTWLVGNALEQEWGAFKLNVFYLIGAIGTAAAAFITGASQGALWLNTSLYFAFATLFPNYEILLFFVLPIRVKWLALLTLGYVLYQFVPADIGTKAAILVAFGNYFLFFAGHMRDLVRGRRLQARQAVRRASFAQVAREREDRGDERECAICHVKQSEGADIRVCSCEKCGSPRELCLEHARNH